MTDPISTEAGVTMLGEGWNLVLTDAGAHAAPGDVPLSAAFIPAIVPGTVAAALDGAGLFDIDRPEALHDRDAWYFCRLVDVAAGAAILRFAGLATIADVYLNGVAILRSESMFEAHDVSVTLIGGDELAICFRALNPFLDAAGPRARWRSQMMDSQGLRLVRTTALGHMPGWCPSVHAVGPWRAISVIRDDGRSVRAVSINSLLSEAGEGILAVAFDCAAPIGAATLSCAGASIPMVNAGDRWSATLAIPDVAPWWPQTHGTPELHEIAVSIDGRTLSLGRTGFRRIAIDRGADGLDFAVSVNGVPVFCRGAVWTSADILRLPGDRESYRPWLQQAAEAGMNMIRIGGTMAYETAAFFELCDELGLMVWQDFMFANFDYPVKDAAFVAHVTAEVGQFLGSTQASPSLAVVCGGSEVYQQGAMMGLPERIWKGPLTEEILPALCRQVRADVPYVVNSPSGGAMPFAPNAGVTHYYGVGAYCRPLEDARRANVRFAAESLAFAHVPQQRTLDRHLPFSAGHDPCWKARVPRDRAASWDFEDIRDHYLTALYGLDAQRLRREDMAHYLDLSRATTCAVVEATYGEWRRAGSSCHGALVWTLQDLLPGAGWGVIDATGAPKPVWYALKRAFRPVQVILTDEGTNGLEVHIVNERVAALELQLELACLRDGQQAVVSGRRAISIGARQSLTIAATDLFGAFFDTTYAFRFGPPSHDVTVARLRDAGGDVIAEAFHFPLGRSAAFRDAAIEASLNRDDDGGWSIVLSTDRLAQSVHIDVEGYRPEDDWFHLAPGLHRRLRLVPLPGTDRDALPGCAISHVGSKRTVRL